MITTILYFTLYPLLLWGVAFLHKKLFIDRHARSNKKNLNNLPKPLWGKWWRHLRFTFTDKREISIGKQKEGENPKKGIQRRFIYWGLYLIGLLIALSSFFINDILTIAIISALFFYTSAIFGINSAKKLLAIREKMMTQMMEIAVSRMGVESSKDPHEVITIKEWRTPENPSKIEIQIPTTFDASGEEGFQRLFNQKFGRITAWVPDTNYQEGIAGWDYENSLLTLRSVPPLPKKAPWDAKYVLHPGIAWSFFPLALGVENGVKIDFGDGPEHVLGIDFSGEQQKMGEKQGVEVAPSLVRAPMSLVAGGTGGGKSLDKKTPVLRLVPLDT